MQSAGEELAVHVISMRAAVRGGCVGCASASDMHIPIDGQRSRLPVMHLHPSNDTVSKPDIVMQHGCGAQPAFLAGQVLLAILVFVRNPLSDLAWTGAIWAPMVPLFLSQVRLSWLSTAPLHAHVTLFQRWQCGSNLHSHALPLHLVTIGQFYLDTGAFS